MRRFSFLLFLALACKAYGQRGSYGVSDGADVPGSASVSLGRGSGFGAGGGYIEAGSTGVLSSNAGREYFLEGWPETSYYGFGSGGNLNGENSGATGLNGNAEGVGGAAISGGYGGRYRSSGAAGSAGGGVGAAANIGNALGAVNIGAGVGSSGYGSSYGDGPVVGLPGRTSGGPVGVTSGLSGGLGGAAVASSLGLRDGFAGNGMRSTHSESIARRRHRGRVAGAVLGSVLGGLAVGGLIAHIAKLRREGRLGNGGRQGGFSSSSYGSYGVGYDYSSNYGSRLLYQGYTRRCKNCAQRRRRCFGTRCS